MAECINHAGHKEGTCARGCLDSGRLIVPCERGTKVFLQPDGKVRGPIREVRNFSLQKFKEFRVDSMSPYHPIDHGADQVVECLQIGPGKMLPHNVIYLRNMALMECDEDGMLVWEVLIDGSNAHPCRFRDPVGSDRRDALAPQDSYGGVKCRIDGDLCSLLDGLSPVEPGRWSLCWHTRECNRKCELLFNSCRKGAPGARLEARRK